MRRVPSRKRLSSRSRRSSSRAGTVAARGTSSVTSCAGARPAARQARIATARETRRLVTAALYYDSSRVAALGGARRSYG
jgi:hypothetical protein